MMPKPSHLGLQYAEQFKDASIAEVYHHRPPYADHTISVLLNLVTHEPRAILDVGCGTGDLARRLVCGAQRVDAVDFSRAMLDRGKTLPGGDHPHLHWICGRVEDVTLQPPYALITAGESLHWMQWEIAFPLFHRILIPRSSLAIVGRGTEHSPWDDGLGSVIARFSTNREFRAYDLLEELEVRHLFQKQGSMRTNSVPFVQSGEEYILSLHSMNGFSRERMGEDDARTFDEAVRGLIAPFLQDGLLTLLTFNTIVWGTPQL